MEKLKIRASSSYKMMTDPKNKSDKEAGFLSETTKTYLKELWLYNNYGFREEVLTDEIIKGVETEEECLSLVQEVLGGNELRLKNKKMFENDFITGTPDIILSDTIEDVKSCFTVKTFMNSELIDNYYMQGQCYMELTGKRKFRLIYCLVQTPQKLIYNEQMKFYYKFNCDEEHPEYIRIAKQIEQNHNIEKIPAKDRIKVFEFDYDPLIIAKLNSRIEKAREFYSKISLT